MLPAIMGSKARIWVKTVTVLLIVAVLLVSTLLIFAPHREVETVIEIAAPPTRVWAVLTDKKAYPDWNPEIAALNGRLVPGAVLENRQGHGDEQMVFWPTVLVVKPDGELRWAGHIWFPGLFYAEHYFLLQPVDGGTAFTQGEKFRGVALWFYDVNQALPGFNANLALKARVEGKK
jgi:hypothetical protein